jgi:hypothetical protein
MGSDKQVAVTDTSWTVHSTFCSKHGSCVVKWGGARSQLSAYWHSSGVPTGVLAALLVGDVATMRVGHCQWA